MDDDELLHWMRVGFDNADRIRAAIQEQNSPTENQEAAADRDVPRAGQSVDDGLDRLFRRLGPPTDR